MSRDSLNKVDWTLPGMEKFSTDDIAFFKRDIEKDEGAIVNSIHCLGWAYWPTKNDGYLDERLLRKIADFIEIQNKPFWNEYERYCDEQEQRRIDEGDKEDAGDSIADFDLFKLPPGTTEGLV